jgi:hypothetical protein
MPRLDRTVKKRTEATIQDEIRAAVAKMPDVTLYRNAVGKMNVAGKWFTYGLGPGSADLVGWITVHPTVTLRIARFLALEVKDPAQPLSRHAAHVADQEAWLAHVRSCGGVAGIVTSVEEAVSLIQEAREWRV